jgi:hypothetical protein
MGFEVDINKFHPIGFVVGVDGNKYAILIGDNLPKKRVLEIQKECLQNKLEIKKHLYDPGEEIIERLRQDLL